jgi:hypothetical protein
MNTALTIAVGWIAASLAVCALFHGAHLIARRTCPCGDHQ